MNQPSLSIWGRLVTMKARIVYHFVAVAFVALKQSQQQLTFYWNRLDAKSRRHHYRGTTHFRSQIASHLDDPNRHKALVWTTSSARLFSCSSRALMKIPGSCDPKVMKTAALYIYIYLKMYIIRYIHYYDYCLIIVNMFFIYNWVSKLFIMCKMIYVALYIYTLYVFV